MLAKSRLPLESKLRHRLLHNINSFFAKFLPIGYCGCSLLNGFIVGGTNLVSIFAAAKEHKNRFKSKFEASVFENIVDSIETLFIFMCCGFYATTKTGLFAMSGPLGSYRIWLAYHNYRKTDDTGWIDPVVGLGAIFDSKCNNYIMQPFGKTSWKPL
jgi:hypothetical protein